MSFRSLGKIFLTAISFLVILLYANTLLATTWNQQVLLKNNTHLSLYIGDILSTDCISQTGLTKDQEIPFHTDITFNFTIASDACSTFEPGFRVMLYGGTPYTEQN